MLIIKHAAACLLCFVLSLPSFAGGAGEINELEEGKIKAYFIAPPEMGNAAGALLMERLYLEPFLAAFLWSEYRLEGGAVETRTTGGYRILHKERFLAEEREDTAIHAYDLEVDYHQAEEGREGRSYSVSFGSGDLLGRRGSLAHQPHQFALLAAIEKHGRDTGLIRIKSLSYTGDGRFRARVEVR